MMNKKKEEAQKRLRHLEERIGPLRKSRRAQEHSQSKDKDSVQARLQRLEYLTDLRGKGR